MKLSELKEFIDEAFDAAESNGDDPEVCLATQPNYPLATHLKGIAFSVVEPPYNPEREAKPTVVVWLLEGYSVHDNPYASRDLWCSEESIHDAYEKVAGSSSDEEPEADGSGAAGV